jgi:spore germination cell wall hydrolase CwlJ-like protein
MAGRLVKSWIIAIALLAAPLLVPSILPPTSKTIQTPRVAYFQSINTTGSVLKVSLPETLGVPEQDYKCLAQAVYFEARSEPVQGQQAVAEVVLNRVSDRRFPDSVCGVVFQNESRRHRCQFSFACDGRSDRPRERQSWVQARQIAAVVLAGLSGGVTGDATHYHATYVRPYWAGRLEKTVQVGQHVFYR